MHCYRRALLGGVCVDGKIGGDRNLLRARLQLAVSPPNAKLLSPASRRHSAATEAVTEAAVLGEQYWS